jgi:hypothetical protein
MLNHYDLGLYVGWFEIPRDFIRLPELYELKCESLITLVIFLYLCSYNLDSSGTGSTGRHQFLTTEARGRRRDVGPRQALACALSRRASARPTMARGGLATRGGARRGHAHVGAVARAAQRRQ